ncbi:MAG: sugar phosphate isomerase/epimerase family protein [Planctomycetota bacterium]
MDITWSIFPKFFKHLSIQQLAELIGQVGLDTTNLVIRKGYWVAPDTLETDAPAFVEAMRSAGLEVRFATAGFMPEQLIADDTPLAVLADCGITEFRMGYFQWDETRSPSACIETARGQMEQLAGICQRRGIRAVYQIHHGTLVPSPWSVWQLVRGLPAEYVGVMLDPGNQAMEGWEKWRRSMALLGDHVVAMGIKDAGVFRDGDPAGEAKGWRRKLEVPLTEGVVNWYEVVRALREFDFAGTFVYMPFYHNDNPQKMTETLAEEVAYLRDVVRQVEQEEA